MKTTSALVWLIAPLCLLSCSDKKLAPLTEAQKAQFQRTITSLAAIPQAVSATKTAQAAGVNRNRIRRRNVAPNPNGNQDEIALSLEQRLGLFVQNGVCTVELNNPSGFQAPTPGAIPTIPTSLNIKMIVSGAQCPIQMNFFVAMNSDPASRQITGSFGWAYSAKSQFLASDNEIDSIDWKGTFGGTMDGGGSGQLRFTSNGTAHSKGDGSLNIYANLDAAGSASGGTMTAAFGIKYPGFTGEFSAMVAATGSGQPQLQFALNGQPITPQEAQKFFQGALGGAQSQGATPPPPQPVVPAPPVNAPADPNPPANRILKTILFVS